MKIRTKDMAFIAIFTVLIVVGAFIKIPIPVVPFTLQFFFTNMAGVLLGKKRGAISVLLYMILGLIGLPIFASGGGVGYVFVPSFGYIPGFVVGTFVTGWIVEKTQKHSVLKYILAGFAGLILVYIVGMIYYYLIANYVIDTPIGLWPLFLYCFLLAVPGDIVLCILCGILAKSVRPVFLKHFA